MGKKEGKCINTDTGRTRLSGNANQIAYYSSSNGMQSKNSSA